MDDPILKEAMKVRFNILSSPLKCISCLTSACQQKIGFILPHSNIGFLYTFLLETNYGDLFKGMFCEQEPIAFLGGVFAGLLRLDLNEEPLKDWVAKTAEAAGIDLDDSQAADMDDSVPEDIRID